MVLRFFGFSGFITIAAVFVAFFGLGPAAAITTIILIAIEVAFSFDNAVINAKVLERMPPLWQKIFLTVGMVIAIFGMRFVFPIVIVMVTAGLPWNDVINDALYHPDVYAEHLLEAHTAIAAFGGAFLLTLTMYFLFDDFREELWLERIERPLQRVKSGVWLPPLLVALTIVALYFVVDHEASTVLSAGLAGVAGYVAIKLFVDGLSKLAGGDDAAGSGGKKTLYTGWAAFGAFMYLEVLDASFSFDGVLGAFAITDKVLLIALGLGVGAIWVRSLTIYLVRKGTLNSYIYLEHGAHYAILALSVALLSSLFISIPDAVTGIAGIGIILASFQASREALHAKQRTKM